MISGILGEIDDRWSEIFQASGQSYKGPRIVLFRNATNGGRCGMAQSAMGPFYCPPDRQIFLDTGFFREVETRFHGCQGSACKFTAAYIIAHEAGHHIQNLLGILPKVTAQQQQLQVAGNKPAANAMQVRVELQADCLSGVWVDREAKKRPGFIEAGDIDGALATRVRDRRRYLAAADDRAGGAGLFTPRLAAQRKQWFMTGYQQGRCQPAIRSARGRCNGCHERIGKNSCRSTSRGVLTFRRARWRMTNRRALRTATRAGHRLAAREIRPNDVDAIRIVVGDGCRSRRRCRGRAADAT